MELSNILNQLLENNKKDKKTIEHICLTYQAIKNNLYKHSLYKKSNVKQFFLNILEQINMIRRGLDFNFKNIYNDYLKKLLFSFEQINFKLLGINFDRDIKIDNLENEIEFLYLIYSQNTISIMENFEEIVFKKINNYEQNYDYYNSICDTQEKLNEIAEEIKKLEEEFVKNLQKNIKEYTDDIKKIKKLLREINNENNLDIKIDDTVFKNFKSKGHLFTHFGILATEVIVRVCTAPFGPIGWGIAIGIHGVFAVGTALYDKINKKNTLIKNVEKFKNQLKKKINGNKKAINELLYNLREDILKELENIIDLQNSEFEGIKNKKEEFLNIFNKFIKIYNEQTDL